MRRRVIFRLSLHILQLGTRLVQVETDPFGFFSTNFVLRIPLRYLQRELFLSVINKNRYHRSSLLIYAGRVLISRQREQHEAFELAAEFRVQIVFGRRQNIIVNTVRRVDQLLGTIRYLNAHVSVDESSFMLLQRSENQLAEDLTVVDLPFILGKP